LNYIGNGVLSTGTFPDRFKFSEIKPLLKKCNRTNFVNYRPISLLPYFSKIIYKRLYQHIINNNILANEQYSFKNNLSTEIATHTAKYCVIIT
jgi:hypothetical protein